MVCHRVGANQPSQNQFRNFQYSRPKLSGFPKFPKIQIFQIFQNFQQFQKLPKFPKLPKTSPLCFGKPCPVGLAILEILEFLDSKISNKFALMFWKSCPLGLAALEMLEFLEYGNFGNLES